MKRWIIICLLFSMSCTTEHKNWHGGEISDYGVYHIDGNKISVYKEDGFLKYNVLGENGDTVLHLHQVEYISASQKWRLYWDIEKNLWVFSADIGHSVWEYDKLSNTYYRKEFYGGINIDSLSNDVLNTLRYFYPYSLKIPPSDPNR